MTGVGWKVVCSPYYRDGFLCAFASGIAACSFVICSLLQRHCSVDCEYE